MTWLHDQQFQMMVERWRSDNPGQEPDEKTIDTLRIQAQMIVDDIKRSQYLEEMEFSVSQLGLNRPSAARSRPTPAGSRCRHRRESDPTDPQGRAGAISEKGHRCHGGCGSGDQRKA